MRKALLMKMDMKMPKTDIKLEEDPFLRLGKTVKTANRIFTFISILNSNVGFGMNAYYDTLKYMMILMMLLFTFSLPSVFIYSSHSGIVKNSMGIITQFSLGNMGIFDFLIIRWY
jgi:lipoprotein signal peptidase